MNREERIFSVTITEEELRLFSEFLTEQKEFGRISDKIDELNEAYEERQRIKEDKKKTKEYFDNKISKILNAKTKEEATSLMVDAHKDLKGHHRLAGKYIKQVDPKLQESFKRQEDEGTLVSSLGFLGDVDKHLTNLGDIYQTEEKLKRTNYDDRYSAKGIERLVSRKIDSDEAKNIVNNRSNLSDSYAKKDGVILKSDKGFRGEVGRRWNDAKMVYGEALDGRSLGKDAALAAAGATALGVGIHAIRKHRKKKKEAQAALDSKYKTKED